MSGPSDKKQDVVRWRHKHSLNSDLHHHLVITWSQTSVYLSV